MAAKYKAGFDVLVVPNRLVIRRAWAWICHVIALSGVRGVGWPLPASREYSVRW
jgi:hypothetical protein